MPPTDSDAKTDTQDIYERVLKIVEHNTHHEGHGSAGMVAEAGIYTIAYRANLDRGTVKSCLRTAVKENDDLVMYEDRDGTRRYARRTKEGLLKAIEWQSAKEDSNQQMIADCNEIRQSLSK